MAPRGWAQVSLSGPAPSPTSRSIAGREDAGRERPVSDVLLAGPKIWICRRRRKAQSRVRLVKRVTVADADAQARAGQIGTNPRGETARIGDRTPLSRRDWPTPRGPEEGHADPLLAARP